jgi:hypothetical protein
MLTYVNDARSYERKKKLPCILLNPKVHYRIHNRPPLVPMLNRINPGQHSYPISLISIPILSSNLHLDLPRGLFPSRCITKTTNFYPRHATSPAHLILLVTEVFNPKNHVNLPVNAVYETSRFVRISWYVCLPLWRNSVKEMWSFVSSKSVSWTPCGGRWLL